MSDLPDNAGHKTGGRSNRWLPGQSGNPRGKPKGCKHKATQLTEQLIGDQASALVQKLVERALAGDATCLRMCIERLLPPLKERPVSIDLPPILDASGVALAQESILQAVASGTLMPREGLSVAGLIEVVRRGLETQDLAERIDALEQKHGSKETT